MIIVFSQSASIELNSGLKNKKKKGNKEPSAGSTGGRRRPSQLAQKTNLTIAASVEKIRGCLGMLGAGGGVARAGQTSASLPPPLGGTPGSVTTGRRGKRSERRLAVFLPV